MCILTKLQRIKQFQAEKKLLTLLRGCGTPRSKVQEIKDEFASKAKKGVKYFYYWGPQDEKTRDFCKSMLKLDKVWSEDEIAVISIELGYDVEKYKGSYNCRHVWRSFKGEIIPTPPPTINQIRKLIDKGISAN